VGNGNPHDIIKHECHSTKGQFVVTFDKKQSYRCVVFEEPAVTGDTFLAVTDNTATELQLNLSCKQDKNTTILKKLDKNLPGTTDASLYELVRIFEHLTQSIAESYT
jgi:uncharacterized protein YpiB (UPF0302 family)